MFEDAELAGAGTRIPPKAAGGDLSCMGQSEMFRFRIHSSITEGAICNERGRSLTVFVSDAAMHLKPVSPVSFIRPGSKWSQHLHNSILVASRALEHFRVHEALGYACFRGALVRPRAAESSDAMFVRDLEIDTIVAPVSLSKAGRGQRRRW